MFQLIYVRGMFPPVDGRLNNRDAGFNSYMRGACFMDGLLMERITDVSTHICAGSVSTLIAGKEPYKLRVSIHICAGNVLYGFCRS